VAELNWLLGSSGQSELCNIVPAFTVPHHCP